MLITSSRELETDGKFVLIFFNASDLSALWKHLAVYQLLAISMQKKSSPNAEEKQP